MLPAKQTGGGPPVTAQHKAASPHCSGRSQLVAPPLLLPEPLPELLPELLLEPLLLPELPLLLPDEDEPLASRPADPELLPELPEPLLPPELLAEPEPPPEEEAVASPA